MSSSTKIEKDKRVNDILLGPLERPALAFFARHMPRWVNSDMLTALGVVGSIVVLFSYIMVGQRGVIKGDWFLLLASLGFVLNWYGDSLDGTLARYRHEERPNYGYFLDHSIDGFTALCIFFGLGLSTLSDLGISMLALAFYLMLMISVTLKTHVTGVFEMTSIKLGPTEIRVIAILFNPYVYLFGNPIVRGVPFAGDVAFGSLVLGVVGLIMFVYFLYETVRTSLKLQKSDEQALARRKAKEAQKALESETKQSRKQQKTMKKKKK